MWEPTSLGHLVEECREAGSSEFWWGDSNPDSDSDPRSQSQSKSNVAVDSSAARGAGGVADQPATTTAGLRGFLAHAMVGSQDALQRVPPPPLHIHRGLSAFQLLYVTYSKCQFHFVEPLVKFRAAFSH